MKMTLEQKVIERYLAEEMPTAAEIIAEFNIPEFQFWDIVLTWTRPNVWAIHTANTECN
jgi:hypothetical protein